MPAPSPWIIETTAETFQQDAVERSREVPVVIDFWASWCQPCRMLGPILERLADEHQGKFVLVKANTEELPDIAAAFGIESIPAVFALREGRLVDQFLGLLPESQIRAWLERILPSQAEQLVAEAQDHEQTNPQAAESKYREAIQQSPNETAAQIGLARVLLRQNKMAESRQILEELASAAALGLEGEQLRAEIMLHEQSKEVGGVDQARAAAEAEPSNLALQLNLARALAAAGSYEEALEIGLKVVQKDRRQFGEPAREFMVGVFHLLGPDSALASSYRRRLALALY